jgi:hypothetical protein
VGGLVRRGHDIYGVPGRGEEEDLEDGVPGAVGEGPEYVDVPGDIYYKIEGLGFEGDAGARLKVGVRGVSFGRLGARASGAIRERTLVWCILCNNIRIDTRWERSPEAKN